MPVRRSWSRQELLAAGFLYCQIPFGRFDQRNPDLIAFAEKIGRTSSAVAMKLCNLASLDPVITQTGRSGLAGASSADRELWQEMNADWPSFSAQAADAIQALGYELDRDHETSDFTGRERPVTRSERIGQNLFRDAVLTAYESQCCITGLMLPQLLVASHIVPWREDPENRLNPANGLCLSSLHDRAFDVGLITIESDMTVALSPSMRCETGDFWSQAIAAYEGQTISLPDKFPPNPDFLARHRQEIFIR